MDSKQGGATPLAVQRGSDVDQTPTTRRSPAYQHASDTLHQLDQLLKKRYQTATVQDDFTLADIRFSLYQINAWLTYSTTPALLAHLCHSFLILSAKYTPSETKRKAIAPKSTDRGETIDDIKQDDDTVDFFILTTFHHVLATTLNESSSTVSLDFELNDGADSDPRATLSIMRPSITMGSTLQHEDDEDGSSPRDSLISTSLGALLLAKSPVGGPSGPSAAAATLARVPSSAERERAGTAINLTSSPHQPNQRKATTAFATTFNFPSGQFPVNSVKSCLRHVPPTMLDFCFDHLHHTHTPATRHAAVRCIGLLSYQFLPEIVARLCNSLKWIKTDEETRAYATFQKVVCYLDFGFKTLEQGMLTVKYFSELKNALKKVERGVLRRAVIDSLCEVHTKIYASMTEDEKLAWQNRQSGSTEVVHNLIKFQDEWHAIFGIVSKWSKKSKHTLFCYQFMARMVQFCSYEFYQKNDVLPLLTQGLKFKMRKKCLELMRDYIRAMPEFFIAKDEEQDSSFEKFKTLLAVLLPQKQVGGNKRAPPACVEQMELEGDSIILVVTEIGRRYVTFLATKYLPSALSSTTYSSWTKSLMYRSVAILAKDSDSDRTIYQTNIGPLVLGFLEDSKLWKLDRKPAQLISVIQCFPEVSCGPYERTLKNAKIVATLTTNSNRAVSNEALFSILDFIHQRPLHHLFPSILVLVKMLHQAGCVSSDGVVAGMDIKLKLFNNLTVVLKLVRDIVRERTSNQDFSPVLSASEWMIARKYLEAVSLIHLCNSDGFVRIEALRVLQLFTFPELRYLERGATDLHTEKPLAFLIDTINKTGVEEDVASTIPHVLIATLKSGFVKHGAIFQFAFSHLFRSDFYAIIDIKNEEKAIEMAHANSPWLQEFFNSLSFLALSLRIKPRLENQLSSGIVKRYTTKEREKAKDSYQAKELEYELTMHQLQDCLFYLFSRPEPCCRFVGLVNDILSREWVAREMQSLQWMVVDALGTTHQSTHDFIVQVVWGDTLECTDSKKSEKLWRKAAFNKFGLGLLAKFLVATDEHETSLGTIVQVLNNIIKLWLGLGASSSEIGSLSPATRLIMLVIIENYLRQCHKEAAAFAVTAWFQFVTTSKVFYPEGPATTLEEEQIEQQLLKCVIGIIAFVPVADESFLPVLLDFLHEVPRHGEYVNASVQEAFIVLLKGNPKLCDLFVMTACIEKNITPSQTKRTNSGSAPMKEKPKKLTQKMSDKEESGAPTHRSSPRPDFEENGHFPSQDLQTVGTASSAAQFALRTISMDTELNSDDEEYNPLDLYHERLELEFKARTKSASVQVMAKRRGDPRQHSLILSEDQRLLVHREGSHRRKFHTKLSGMYMKAVCQAWIDNMETWVYVEGVPPSKMVAFSLLHQNSPDRDLRASALRLASTLAARSEAAVDPGFEISTLTHESPFMYHQAALSYSTALAKMPEGEKIVVELLVEAEKMFSLVNKSSRENFFRVLLPWIEIVGSSKFIKSLTTGTNMKTATTAEIRKATLLETLNSASNREDFIAFLATEHSEENVLFWSYNKAAQGVLKSMIKRKLKSISQMEKRKLRRMVISLVDTYVREEAATQVNLGASTVRALTEFVGSSPFFLETDKQQKNTLKLEEAVRLADILQNAQAEIFNLMASDSWPRFINNRFSAGFSNLSFANVLRQSEAFSSVLRALLSISLKSHRDSLTVHIVTDIWTGLLKTENSTQLIPVVIAFLLEQHKLAQIAYNSNGAATAELQALLRVIMILFVRTPKAEVVLEVLTGKLKLPREDFPTNFKDYTQWQTQKQVRNEKPTDDEVAAWQLVYMIALETGKVLQLQRFFPLMLHNGLVLFHGDVECSDILFYAAQSLNFREIIQDDFSVEAEAFIATLFAKNPPIAEAWAQTALQWGLGSNDDDHASRSFNLLGSLLGHSFVVVSDFKTITSCCLGLHSAFKTGLPAKATSILKLFSMPSLGRKADCEKAAIALFVMAWCAAHSRVPKISSIAFKVLGQTVRKQSVKTWLIDLPAELQHYVEDEQVVRCLTLGLRSRETQEKCLEILFRLAFINPLRQPLFSKMACLALLYGVIWTGRLALQALIRTDFSFLLQDGDARQPPKQTYMLSHMAMIAGVCQKQGNSDLKDALTWLISMTGVDFSIISADESKDEGGYESDGGAVVLLDSGLVSEDDEDGPKVVVGVTPSCLDVTSENSEKSSAQSTSLGITTEQSDRDNAKENKKKSTEEEESSSSDDDDDDEEEEEATKHRRIRSELVIDAETHEMAIQMAKRKSLNKKIEHNGKTTLLNTGHREHMSKALSDIGKGLALLISQEQFLHVVDCLCEITEFPAKDPETRLITLLLIGHVLSACSEFKCTKEQMNILKNYTLNIVCAADADDIGRTKAALSLSVLLSRLECTDGHSSTFNFTRKKTTKRKQTHDDVLATGKTLEEISSMMEAFAFPVVEKLAPQVLGVEGEQTTTETDTQQQQPEENKEPDATERIDG